jgi:hypothetical protein
MPGLVLYDNSVEVPAGINWTDYTQENYILKLALHFGSLLKNALPAEKLSYIDMIRIHMANYEAANPQ